LLTWPLFAQNFHSGVLLLENLLLPDKIPDKPPRKWP
jgi:hypothetical protein